MYSNSSTNYYYLKLLDLIKLICLINKGWLFHSLLFYFVCAASCLPSQSWFITYYLLIEKNKNWTDLIYLQHMKMLKNWFGNRFLDSTALWRMFVGNYITNFVWKNLYLEDREKYLSWGRVTKTWWNFPVRGGGEVRRLLEIPHFS